MSDFTGQKLYRALFPFSDDQLVEAEKLISDTGLPMDNFIEFCHRLIRDGENILRWNLVEEIYSCILWRYDTDIIESYYNSDFDYTSTTTWDLETHNEDGVIKYRISNKISEESHDSIKEIVVNELTSLPDNKKDSVYDWFVKKLKEDINLPEKSE